MQLSKMKMNFIGLHTYPITSFPGPEPTVSVYIIYHPSSILYSSDCLMVLCNPYIKVWIGLDGEFTENGTVTNSYPASYMTSLRGNWGKTE